MKQDQGSEKSLSAQMHSAVRVFPEVKIEGLSAETSVDKTVDKIPLSSGIEMDAADEVGLRQMHVISSGRDR